MVFCGTNLCCLLKLSYRVASSNSFTVLWRFDALICILCLFCFILSLFSGIHLFLCVAVLYVCTIFLSNRDPILCHRVISLSCALSINTPAVLSSITIFAILSLFLPVVDSWHYYQLLTRVTALCHYFVTLTPFTNLWHYLLFLDL